MTPFHGAQIPYDQDKMDIDPQTDFDKSDNSSEYDYADFVKNYFTDKPKFRYIKHLSPGISAHPILIAEHEEDGNLLRKLVLKFATDAMDDKQIDSEINMLKFFRDAPHIINTIDVDTSGLYRPILIMEYAARGDMAGLVDRLKNDPANPIVPDRVLWRVFLCLTRAVIAMAYLPSTINPLGEQIARETIPSVPVVPSLLEHLDMHQGNVLLGDFTWIDPEHSFTPIFKLADFGEAKVVPVDPDVGNRTAVAKNIADAALLVMLFAERLNYTDYSGGAEYQYPDPPGGPPGSGKKIETLATDEFAINPASADLKALMYRCMADDLNDRPELPEVLRDCENAVSSFTEAYYAARPGGGDRESDRALRAFVRDYLFDADTDEEAQSWKLANSSIHTWRNVKMTKL